MLKLIPCCILFVLAQSLISFILFKKVSVAVKEVYFQITQFKMIIVKKKPACLLKLQGRFNEAKAFLKQSVQQWHVDYVIC